jgi:hypothetical protein
VSLPVAEPGAAETHSLRRDDLVFITERLSSYERKSRLRRRARGPAILARPLDIDTDRWRGLKRGAEGSIVASIPPPQSGRSHRLDERSAPLPNPRVVAIDILRGVAILWVVIFHLWGDMEFFPPPASTTSSSRGR